MTDNTFNALAYQHSEQQVIGGLIVNDELREKYIDTLSGEDFTDGAMAEIFTKLCSQHKQGGVIDPVLLINACEPVVSDAKQLIVDAFESFVSSSTFPEHVAYVKKAAQNRRIKSKIESVQLNGQYDVAALQEIIDSEESCKQYNVADKCSANIRSFVDGLNQPKDTVSTGLQSLDEKLGGIRRGTLFIIGARPSTGKTTFALNIAKRQLYDKRHVLFFSLEMSSAMIFERYAADVCNIDSSLFSRNRLSDRQTASVKNLMRSIENGKKLFVIDDAYTIEAITRIIYSEKPDVAIIDYVQRIRSLQHFKTERELINRITSELKIAAKRTKTCVILLSQISRAGKEVPRMSDLKESGALEEDGDYIAFCTAHLFWINPI